ncbi:MAG: hypothetical protein ACEPOZ_02440, partial [Marinifilaceae bacterium]
MNEVSRTWGEIWRALNEVSRTWGEIWRALIKVAGTSKGYVRVCSIFCVTVGLLVYNFIFQTQFLKA